VDDHVAFDLYAPARGMWGTRLKRGRRVALLAACAGALALPASASASVYCVDVTGGDCVQLETGDTGFVNALNGAIGSAEADTIRLGAATYEPPTSAGFGYITGSGSGSLAVVGAGVGETTIAVKAPDAAPAGFTQYYGLRIQGPAGSSVSDLMVTLPSPAPGGNQQYRGIEASNLSVDEVEILGTDPALEAFGAVINSGSFTDSSVELANAVGLANAGNSATDLVVDRASLGADTALRYSNELTGKLTVRRSSLAGIGSAPVLNVQAGTAAISDSVIDLGTLDAVGLDLQNPNNNNDAATLTADHLTIVGGGPGSVGAQAWADSGPDAADNTPDGESYDLTLTNSVISGPTQSVTALADRGETATVTVAYSNYTAPTIEDADSTNGGGSGFATLTDSNVTSHSNPGFVDPAGDNFHLLPGSPLVDIGDPAPSSGGEVDLDGDPRVLDGTPDCFATSRRDIGADEFVTQGLLDCIEPETMVTGKGKVKAKTKKKRATVSFTLSSTEPGSTFECSLDGSAFAPCASTYSTKAKVGEHTLVARAKDASGNVDATPAKVTFRVTKKKPKKK
jgi:hypothetical protein